MTFKKGQSGNPTGRPKGSRNKATLAVERLLVGEAEAITRRCIERALEGDPVALRLCMERLLPPVKVRPVAVDLGKIDAPGDLLRAHNRLLEAVASGAVSLDALDPLLRLIEAARKTMETAGLQEEFDRLEARLSVLTDAQE